jgi:hypothetical protein
MDVFDHRGSRVGSVAQVYLGAADEDAIAAGTGPATTPDLDPRGGSLLEGLARTFDPEELPAPLRARLLQHGFIRIDVAGLFASDRYAMPEHIASVTGGGIHLRVGPDQLMAA